MKDTPLIGGALITTKETEVLEEKVVDEVEFMKAMQSACKEYLLEISEIQETIQRIEFYKANGYNIKYTFNKENNSYEYRVSKRRIGFK